MRWSARRGQRLQPCHVQSFFVEAFQHLGGRLKRREEGRWEITQVPAAIRERDRQIGTGAAIQRKYERICFEKHRINRQPVAAFIYPGHPLLEAVISIVREKYDYLMRQGAVLVDDTDTGEDLSAVFLLEHDVRDGRQTSTGKPHIISEKLQFAALDKGGHAGNAGIAPHLNLRQAQPEEIALLEDSATETWLRSDLEQTATEFATVDLAQAHVAEVKARRLPEIAKIEQEVRARLQREINYWDSRAFELKEQERAGKKTRLNWQNAARRAEDLAERLKQRMALLEQEKIHLVPAAPYPRRHDRHSPRSDRKHEHENRKALLRLPQNSARTRSHDGKSSSPPWRQSWASERGLGNAPADVSAQKIGYDIASYDPNARGLRFIEVKGRVDGADTVMITRQEIIASLHEPEKFILAVVKISDGSAGEPRYVRGALDKHEPPFEQTAIQFNLKRLLERAEPPA